MIMFSSLIFGLFNNSTLYYNFITGIQINIGRISSVTGEQIKKTTICRLFLKERSYGLKKMRMRNFL